jgi:hypothetical protein
VGDSTITSFVPVPALGFPAARLATFTPNPIVACEAMTLSEP